MPQYQDIIDLYKETCIKLSSPREWMSFLSSACRNYKLKFADLVLVYAQKPDAIAVLELHKWKKQFNRWVNKGSKGIGVIDASNPSELKVKYYFDITDTTSGADTLPVPIWEYDAADEQLVISSLKAVYGDFNYDGTIYDGIVKAAKKGTHEYISDYLFELEKLNISVDSFETLLTNSVAYMLMSRLRLEPTTYTVKDFELVKSFDTAEAVNLLGVATRNISADGLQAIGKSILSNRTFESIYIKSYTETEKDKEGVAQDENRVREIRKHSVSEVESPDASEEGQLGEIRPASQQVSAGESRGDIHNTRLNGNPGRVSDEDRPSSRANGGNPDESILEAGEPIGTAQEREPSVMDSNDERNQTQSSGDRSVGSRLSGISTELPPFVDNDLIQEIIFNAKDNLLLTKEEIFNYFNTHSNQEQRSNFVSSLYSPQRTELLIGNTRVGYCSTDNGLLLWEGKYPSREKESVFSWALVAELISAQIEEGAYYSNLIDTFGLSTENGQIGLLDLVNSVSSSERVEPTITTAPQSVTDEALRIGSNQRNSILDIVSFFRRKRPEELKVDFLQRHYGTNGAGFFYNGEKYSMWYDENGISIARGNSAKSPFATQVSWIQAAQRISELLADGAYTTKEMLDKVDDREISFVADRISTFYHDIDAASKERCFPTIYDRLKDGKTFPDTVSTVRSLLTNEATLNDLYNDYIVFLDDYNKGTISDVLNYAYNSSPKYVFEVIKGFSLEKAEYHAADSLSDERLYFITDDEIDDFLCKHCPFEDGNRTIYDYFVSHSDLKGRADMLKAEYGEGGYLSGNDNVSYSSKGITISHGNISEPYASVNLKWEVVAKRIDKLITRGVYYNAPVVVESAISSTETRTPEFVSEYDRLKADYPNTLLFMRIGDFYEVLGEDAKTVSKEIDLVLTGRTIDTVTGERTAMCGVPTSTIESYITKLILKGYTVALADDNQVKRVISSQRQEQNDLVEKALRLIHEYKQREFETNEVDHYDDLSNIGLAYTETEDGKDEIEVSVDLVNYTLAQKLNGTVIAERKYASLEELIDNELEGMSFDDLVYIEPETLFAHKSVEKFDFNLRDFDLEPAGKKERFRRNVAALKTVKQIQSENRLATPEEQMVLAQYVGWGGLSEAFDKNNSSWNSEYNELRGLLSPEEYTSARESTLTAFYTPKEVIEAIYKTLDNLGFINGNLLEPSCGIGHFIGMLPDKMKDSRIFGVELDTVSAEISHQLYQSANIDAAGFEQTAFPDNFFDVVVGNVPFGDFKVADKRYDKNKFLIHDYFFAKSIDKVRAGGIIALITSKGTLDKESPVVRRYIAQRADLLGAIRLPNTAFKGTAGTEVVSDILILQKRERPSVSEPDWVYLGETEEGFRINNYFIDHPEMVLGDLVEQSSRFGTEVTCVPHKNISLKDELTQAIKNINGNITEIETDIDVIGTTLDDTIPADPTVRNYSYTVIDDKLYYRENSLMSPVNQSEQTVVRTKELIKIRDCVRNLLEMQLDGFSDEAIKDAQFELNSLYDAFTDRYGLINSRTNLKAFKDDASSSLICTLEILDEDGNFVSKADMFSKRTIKPHIPVTSVETASEALAVSISEKATVDMEYMMQLSGKSEKELLNSLRGVVFVNPLYEQRLDEPQYLMADEYLSGNVREKLVVAESAAKSHPEVFSINVESLKKVQPTDLTASEIEVRLGATWIPLDVINDFVYELLSTPTWARRYLKVEYSKQTGDWGITGKTYDSTNIKANSTYGTGRMNAYRIIEDTLNLKDARVYDYFEDENGKRKSVLNADETAIAQSKQESIKQQFKDWVWSDQQRRTRLCAIYNKKFNSIRPREYDGSHISFSGMNPEVSLRQHQKNAVAHILYGGNTLLAHAVGAGKTYEMVAAAQESKRLGLCTKSLFVVPNHLTEQWASEYLTLYPSANILVATKKDFETRNRKKFCSKIATGDYDAVIIGHSQFEKIPMSIAHQREVLETELNDILDSIEKAKMLVGENFTVKQLERAKKSITAKLDKLNDQSRKDDVVTFEELGVDRLFIDESHYFKNLYLYTKMRNVGGIAQTEAQKSSDLYMKCRYLDKITGGKGVVFATGTPISNSMVELYTIQRYLQYGTLHKNDLQNFDAWASTFGETVTAIELTPEGTGYRAKTRFAKFYNLPELMAMFKEVADIQTADMLDLPVPKATYNNVAVKPSDIQKEMVEKLAERADAIRGGGVDSSVDNMLLITNDGRKLALDQRLIDENLPDFDGSKVNACTDSVYRIWKDTANDKLTQLLFCDLSTPKSSDSFSVYTDVKSKLIERGVPENEIAFIHDAKTETQKKELFNKVCAGDVRILIGSTSKMGAGTNVQDRLIALHDLDCPWRPSDLEQRSGRIIRQGNQNPEVFIYRYVTEETFDAYLYQLVESKQKFISQIMTSKSPVRSAEDVDEAALSYAEIKMLATGNPYIKEKMDLDIQVQKLKLLKSNYLSQKYSLEDKIVTEFPQSIASLKETIEGIQKDLIIVAEHPKSTNDDFVGIVINGKHYSKKSDAGEAILTACKSLNKPVIKPLGKYRGFSLDLCYDFYQQHFLVYIKGNVKYACPLGNDAIGNITRLDNKIDSISQKLEETTQRLENEEKQLLNAQEEVKKPFSQEAELQEKEGRLNELNILLNLDKHDNEIVADSQPVSEMPKSKEFIEKEI